MKIDVQAQLWRIRRKLNNSRIQKVVRSKGFWFVDVPRTGSTSIKSQLASAAGTAFGKSTGGVLCLPDHTSAQEAQAIFGNNTWDSLFTFTFVRNPWDRLLSLYKFRCKYGNLENLVPSFEEYVLSLQSPTYSYRLKESPFWDRVYFWNQCDFICNASGRVIVKHVYRFEDRADALSEISQKIGLDISSEVLLLPTKETSDYRSYYSDRSRKVVESYCREDIVKFGYSF